MESTYTTLQELSYFKTNIFDSINLYVVIRILYVEELQNHIYHQFINQVKRKAHPHYGRLHTPEQSLWIPLFDSYPSSQEQL